MEFGLTQHQRMLKKQVNEFVKNEMIGQTLDWDDGENFPEEVYQSLADMGVLGLVLPEELGGESLNSVTGGIVFEELGRGDVGLTTYLLAANLIGFLLGEHGTEYHRDIASKSATGDLKLSFALTEPGQGSDAQAIEASAHRDGDEWVLSGEKTAITGATIADYCLVYAREAETDGIRGFLVPLDQDSVEVESYPAMGCKVSGWGQIYLDDARAPEDAKLGEKNGFKMAMEGFDISRAWIALYCLGAAQQTIDETVTYLTEREAFGKPLAGYEGPQFQIAEHQTYVDATRLKAYEALWLADQGEQNTKDAAMVKWLAPKIATEAIHESLVLHGHYGYSRDFGIEKRLRDTIGLEIGDGTPQIQKLVIARETFGSEYLPY